MTGEKPKKITAITHKLSIDMKRFPKDLFVISLIDPDGQMYAEWELEVPPCGSLTLGPFLFAAKFQVE